MFAHHTDRFMTEKELIVSLKQGDEAAFTALYRMYWPKVHNFSRLYLSSIAEVEEVVQEVFVKLWEARIFLKEDESFKGFLFIITRNIIFNQFRKSFNENAYKTTVLSSAEVEYDIENEMQAYLEYDPDVFRGKTVLLPCDDPGQVTSPSTLH